jgi:uncharacterized membrane protein
MEDKELKHEFELERVILFSDAVFAIIITIMVLDVKLPEGLRHAPADKIRLAFMELIPKVIVYIVSFFLVSAFWIRHLKIFKLLRDYNDGLLYRNLLFLVIISLFPFAISNIARLSLSNYWTVDIYVIIVLLGITAQTFIVQYIVKHKQILCFNHDIVETKLKWKVQKLNFILIPMALAVIAVVNIFQFFMYL